MAKPLEGLLVIELATYWVGPSAGAYLRAQGARVIKIEQPPYGDSTRFFARTCGVPPIPMRKTPYMTFPTAGKSA